MRRLRPGRWRRGLRRERGVAAVEFVALLPLLLLSAAFAWQLLLLAASANAAENAARTGSRAATRGGDGAAEALEALPGWLRDGADIGGGNRMRVSVEAPLLFPGTGLSAVRLTRTAELPPSS